MNSDQSNLFLIYVLECNSPHHYYVGYSAQFPLRYKKHLKGQGAAFTAKHGVRGLIDIYAASSQAEANQEERETYLAWKQKPGYTVRGAGYTRSDNT